MMRTDSQTPSSFGREVVVRSSRNVADALHKHMRQNKRQEQMAFGLASHARTADGTLLIVNELILPDKCDLSEQSACGVCPTQEFQSIVYFHALQSQSTLVEFHSHPGGQRPSFSGTDETYAHQNGEYIREKLPAPITLALVVGNNCFDEFDGVIYDRHLRRFRQLDRLEILGRPSELRLLHADRDALSRCFEQEFERQVRIPGWDQEGLERLRITIVGLGGNGAPLLQTLISIGAGRQGFLTLVDPDCLEASNLPRTPYAFGEHVGTPKVTVAAQYAGRKSPTTPVYPFPCTASERAAIDRIKMSNVIFGCGDNEGLRKELNELAVRYRIPYIDLGCDIQTAGKKNIAGGQVRVVLPGENACLVCCGGFDPSEAAMDQMDDVGRAQRAARGYVRGSEETATASVANLNGLTAQYAVSQLLALVNGPTFGNWDYLHFDQFTGRTIQAQSKRRPECPVCGDGGFLGAGDPVNALKHQPRTLMKLEAST